MVPGSQCIMAEGLNGEGVLAWPELILQSPDIADKSSFALLLNQCLPFTHSM